MKLKKLPLTQRLLLHKVFVLLLIVIGLGNSVSWLLTRNKLHTLRLMNLSPDSMVFYEPQFFVKKQVRVILSDSSDQLLSFSKIKDWDHTNNLFHAVLFAPYILQDDRERMVDFFLCRQWGDKLSKVIIEYVDNHTQQVLRKFEWQCRSLPKE